MTCRSLDAVPTRDSVGGATVDAGGETASLQADAMSIASVHAPVLTAVNLVRIIVPFLVESLSGCARTA
jgi:hypothetical protein